MVVPLTNGRDIFCVHIVLNSPKGRETKKLRSIQKSAKNEALYAKENLSDIRNPIGAFYSSH